MAQVLVTARAGALLPTPSEGDDRLDGPSRPALDPVPSALGTPGNPVVAIFYPDESSKRGNEHASDDLCRRLWYPLEFQRQMSIH